MIRSRQLPRFFYFNIPNAVPYLYGNLLHDDRPHPKTLFRGDVSDKLLLLHPEEVRFGDNTTSTSVLRIFEDIVSDAKMTHDGLSSLLDYACSGDGLVVRIDHLGRSLRNPSRSS